MKNMITFKFAAVTGLIIYALFILFHLSILIGIGLLDIVPIDYLWGGRIQTREQFISAEVVSIFVLLVCLFLTLIKARYLSITKLSRVSHYAMWVFFVYFLLNTVGNVLAKTTFEKSLAVISALLSLLSLRLAVEKEKKQ